MEAKEIRSFCFKEECLAHLVSAWLIIYSCVFSPLPAQVVHWTSGFEVDLELQRFHMSTWQIPCKKKKINPQKNVFAWCFNSFHFYIYIFDPLAFILVYSMRCGSTCFCTDGCTGVSVPFVEQHPTVQKYF